MNISKKIFDVCILGGGPAGAMIALKLAMFGNKVILIEKKKQPKRNIGFSLTKGALHWLNLAGITAEHIQTCAPIKGFSVQYWAEKEIVKQPSENQNIYIDRIKFENLVLKKADEAGATIIKGIDVSVCLINDDHWIIDTNNVTFSSIKSRFLVEACGRKSITKTKKIAYTTPTTVTYAYWSSLKKVIPLSIVEAGLDHWSWAATAGERLFAICVFHDPKKNHKYVSRKDLLSQSIQSSRYFPKLLKSMELESIHTTYSTCHYTKEPIKINSIKIGDSAITIDPISSQGMEKALMTAFQGSIVVNSILSDINSESAINFYKRMIVRLRHNHSQWSKELYHDQFLCSPIQFWSRRSEGYNKFVAQPLTVPGNGNILLHSDSYICTAPFLDYDHIGETEAVFSKKHEKSFVFMEKESVALIINLIEGKEIDEALLSLSLKFGMNKAKKIIDWLYQKEIIQVKS